MRRLPAIKPPRLRLLPTSTPYSGPSLDAIYAALVAAAVKGMQNGDTGVTCPGMSGYRGFGIGTGSRATAVATMPVRAVAGGVPARSILTDTGSRVVASPPSPSVPTSCATPSASPWVWNYYLVNLGMGVSTAPDITAAFPGVDDSQAMTASQYWAGVSPLISRSLGMSGLGIFGSSFRRGFGDAASDAAAALSAQQQADFAAVQASAASGGSDTSTGAPGSMWVPVGSSTPAASLIPNVSNGALALGAGALFFLFVMGAHR